MKNHGHDTALFSDRASTVRRPRAGLLLLVLLGLPACANKVLGWATDDSADADELAPTVIWTGPDDGEQDVSYNRTLLGVFSEAMDPETFTTDSFTLESGSVRSAGEVTAVSANMALFTPDDDLEPETAYTVTLTGEVADLAGNTMSQDYAWTFTTGAFLDLDAPRVILTYPEDEATDVAVTTIVRATFDEDMNPTTIDELSFELTGPGASPVTGTVTYDAPSRTGRFTPSEDLLQDTLYTATITTGAWDLAGNALAEDYVWSFTIPDSGVPEVIGTDPEDLETGVDADATVSATFSEDMDPLTLDGDSFVLTGPGATSVSGTVSYEETSQTATFSPDSALTEGATYTATITTGARDLEGQPLDDDHAWTFSTPSMFPIDLGSLETFVAVAGAGLTNSNSAGTTTLGGDVGLYPTATCLGDGATCTALNPVITGTLYAADPDGIAAQALADLTTAYTEAFGRPTGTLVNDISGMTLLPGVYTSASTMSLAVGGTVTLDAGGDPNAVWIFQIGSSLTVGNSASVLLINGADAENVYWSVFASSTLGSNVDFQGTVMAGASNSVGTGSVVVGRLLCTTGAITLLSNTITLPASE